MMYLKSIKQFNISDKINEYWFPSDIYLVPKNNQEVSSYLEFRGNYLTEILGRNRNLENLVNYIRNIINNSESISDMFDAHIPTTKKEDSPETHVKQLDGFFIQISDPNEIKSIEQILKNFSNISVVKQNGLTYIKIELHNSIQLSLNLNYIDL